MRLPLIVLALSGLILAGGPLVQTKAWLEDPSLVPGLTKAESATQDFDLLVLQGRAKARYSRGDWTLVQGIGKGDITELERAPWFGRPEFRITMVRPIPSDEPIEKQLARLRIGPLGGVRGLACRVGDPGFPDLITKAGLRACEVMYDAGTRPGDPTMPVWASVEGGKLVRLLMASGPVVWEAPEGPGLVRYQDGKRPMIRLLAWEQVLRRLADVGPAELSDTLAGTGLERVSGSARTTLDATLAQYAEAQKASAAAAEAEARATAEQARVAAEQANAKLAKALSNAEKWESVAITERISRYRDLVVAFNAASSMSLEDWKATLPKVEARTKQLKGDLEAEAMKATAEKRLATAYLLRLAGRRLRGEPEDVSLARLLAGSTDEATFARLFLTLHPLLIVTPDSDRDAAWHWTQIRGGGVSLGTAEEIAALARSAGVQPATLTVWPLKNTVRERIEESSRPESWTGTERIVRPEYVEWMGKKARIEAENAECERDAENRVLLNNSLEALSTATREESILRFKTKCWENRKRSMAGIGSAPPEFGQITVSGERTATSRLQVWEGTISREFRVSAGGIEVRKTLSEAVHSASLVWTTRENVERWPLASLDMGLEAAVNAAIHNLWKARFEKYLATVSAGWTPAEADLERRAWGQLLGMGSSSGLAVYLPKREPPSAPTPPRPPKREGLVPRCPADMVIAANNKLCVDITKVTNAAYIQCLASKRCSLEPGTGCEARTDLPNYPVDCIRWDQADHYCQVLGRRLPTAGEWLEILQGDRPSLAPPWGNADPTGRACREHRCPVGIFPAGNTPEGIQDLMGNGAELTSTVQDGTYIGLGGSPTSVGGRLVVEPTGEVGHRFRCVKEPEPGPPLLPPAR